MSKPPRWYSFLLKVLPASFRDEHEDELRDLADMHTLGLGGWRRAAAWVRAALDVIWVATCLRVEAFSGSAKKMGGHVAAAASVESLARDVRFSFRSLRRDIGFATFSVLVIGLGVGASTTVFSLANALLFEPLPFHDPDRLVWISNGDPGSDRGQRLSELSVQPDHVKNLREFSSTLVDVAGYSQYDRAGDRTLTGVESPLRMTRLRVTYNFFDVLGIEPLRGRSFTREEADEGGTPATVLPHGAWIRLFGADPTIVGRSIQIDGVATTVVGVLPPSFDFNGILSPGTPVDFIAPFPLSPETNRRGNSLALIGRLAEGSDPKAAEAEARAIVSRHASPELNEFAPRVTYLREYISGSARAPMWLLLAAVGLLMLIVCGNLSNLLIVRGMAREGEFSVRRALGASQGALMRQLLTESSLLAMTGSVLGVMIAWVGTSRLAQLDATIPLLSRTRIDFTALGATLAIALTTCLVFGILPAFRLSRVSLADSMKQGSSTTSDSGRTQRVRSALVITEVALACVLLIGGGLLARSLTELLRVDLGFEPDNAIAIRVDPISRFDSREEASAYWNEVLDRAGGAPGVESVGIIDVMPMAFNRTWCFKAVGQVAPPQRPGCDYDESYVRVVSEGYRQAMGLTLLGGRDILASDVRGTPPVVLVNDAMASRFWPGEDPIGRRVETAGAEWEVVGVVGGMRYLAVVDAPGLEVFFPIRQNGDYSGLHLIARGVGDPAEVTASLREALSPMKADMPLSDVSVLRDIVDRSLASERVLALLVVGFAAFALVLAALGIYGVIAYSVSQRRREIGIRVALGATSTELQWRIVRDTLRLSSVGIIVGLAAAWIMRGVMNGLLFGVSPSDPTTFTMVPLLLLGVSAAAGYLPARQAARLDPIETLRAS